MWWNSVARTEEIAAVADERASGRPGAVNGYRSDPLAVPPLPLSGSGGGSSQTLRRARGSLPGIGVLMTAYTYPEHDILVILPV
jgi:hypothetical protein